MSDDRVALPWPDPLPTFTDLSGAAGSGKTFLTKQWAEQEPGLLLCATTGIAAINLGGSTINAQLGYFDTASLQESYTQGFLTAKLGKLWKVGVRRIVLDEKSMLDADQLTYITRAVEEVNRRGYVLEKIEAWDPEDLAEPPNMGLTLVGDFAQLSPVKALYAFESPEWGRFGEHSMTLQEIRRQDDPDFIQALRYARQGEGRKALEYFGPHLQMTTDDHFDGPTIFAKNESVDRFNQLRMDRLPGPPILFGTRRWGKQRSEWGDPLKPKESWGIPETLRLKAGALVMILANRRYSLQTEGRTGYAYVNGDLGTLQSADPETYTAVVTLHRTGEEVEVDYITRQVKTPCDAIRREELREQGLQERIDGKWEIQGEITYMPLRLAYASTVHKAQGLSLDKVQLNIREHFFKQPGMVYVGLSRARTAEGLRLVGTPKAFLERCVADPKLAGWL